MTILMFIIGVLLISVSGRLAAHAISVPRVQLRRHLHDIGDYGFAAEPESAAGQVTSRGQLNDAFAAYADRVGRFAIAYLPALRPLRRGELAAASFYESTPEAVHGYRAFAAIFLATLVALLAAMTGGVSLLTVVLMVALAAAGWQLPAVVIRSRGKARLKQVDKELPELIDLLIATVEAGMAFSASLVLVSTRIQGPLGDEVRLAIRHQDLGISTSEADPARARDRHPPPPPASRSGEDAQGAGEDAFPDDVPDHAGPDDRALLPGRLPGGEGPLEGRLSRRPGLPRTDPS